MGGIYIADPRTAVADFSIPYIVTDIAALIHVPRELSKWAALMRPYQNNVWIPLAFTLLMSGPIGFLISQKDRSNRRKFSMQQVYETAFKIFTQQGKIADLRDSVCSSHPAAPGSSAFSPKCVKIHLKLLTFP